MKILSFILIAYAIVSGVITAMTVVGESQHFGSRLRSPETKEHLKYRLDRTDIQEAERIRLHSEMTDLIEEGANGYSLLFDIVITQGVSSILLLLGGIALWSRSETEPKYSNKSR